MVQDGLGGSGRRVTSVGHCPTPEGKTPILPVDPGGQCWSRTLSWSIMDFVVFSLTSYFLATQVKSDAELWRGVAADAHSPCGLCGSEGLGPRPSWLWMEAQS